MGRRSLDKHELLLVVLAVLAEQPHSGGELLVELQRRLALGWAISGGRVFVALDALEAEDLAKVDTRDGRACYRLTPAGMAALKERAGAPVLATLSRSPEAAPADAKATIGQLGQVAVLFTDIVSSSALFDRHGTAHAHEMLRRHFTLLRSAVSDSGGLVVKSLGDGLMVVFAGPGPAVECALAMQRAVADCADPLELRVGIASGEAVCDEDDYFGRPVIVARRLCDVARPGDVLVAEATHRLIPASAGQRLEPVGELQLKGLSEPVAASAMRTGPRAA
ncbi:MAG: adenylate/guanylate cyclase domain-containing protein [Thermoleophilaceae bacterium]